MKKTMMIIVFSLLQLGAIACEACKKQQPKIVRGITHGAGPQSDWDYVIVCFITLIVVVSFFYSIKWIIRPGEKENEHIKYSILNME